MMRNMKMFYCFIFLLMLLCVTSSWAQNKSNPDIRLLAKLTPVREVAGGSEHRTAVYTSVHEDSSTEPTHKFPTGVEFGKKSIIKIVAAENSYAQVAQFLGGDYVRVHSMMPKL